MTASTEQPSPAKTSGERDVPVASDRATTAAVPDPEQKLRWWVLLGHVVAVSLVQSTWMASQFMLPVLARKRFDANEWETLLITATPTIFFALSIFWNDLFSRRPLAKYLGVYWVWACLPYAFAAFAQSYWMLLVPHLLACVGGAGYHPAAGELLKALYPDRIRGRVYGWVWGASMVVTAAVAYGLGVWLDHDQNAFRVFMPIGAGLQLLGVGVFLMLAHRSGHLAKRTYDRTADGRSTWARVVGPIARMRETLKADPVFLRYEGAYMTYGVGWMIGYALLPILVTEKLQLNYHDIAQSTQTAYLLAMVVMILPAGWLMDRVGAVKSAALSFALLTFYPLGLAFASNADQLKGASVWFGIAHAGASMAWMLGPVALAPTNDKVPQYVAIHATLVGIRGKLFQFAGVGLLWATGGFVVPLVVAAAAYVWASIQMYRLDKLVQARKAEKAKAG